AQAADAWPTQPLKAIVPFGPGSSPDQVARIVGEKAGAILGQTVVVENKPGASGVLGLGDVVNAKPDGYRIVLSSTELTFLNHLGLAKFSYKDLRP
ncbi:tripartite tricarboxylate transporter substrate binding protein, partial [Xylella fastidiosa subsp. multiplex]|nr:tripartite tricarboxylate transporter substrate binding protein [Xylella fastidiosa subsp. multiplex]